MGSYEELSLEINGIKTLVRKAGNGYPLAYWHGALGAKQWYAHHDLLAQHFTVYAPDHPGWGDSDNADNMDTLFDYVLHYDKLFRILKIERPILVGHALGAWMAALFAITYPDRIKGLGLVNAAGFPFTEESVPDFFEASNREEGYLARLIFQKPEVAKKFFPEKPLIEDQLRSFRELSSTARLTWHCWFDEKLPSRLKRLTIPTRILWGAHDRIFPPELAHKYASVISNAQLNILPDCGHMVPYEKPEALVSMALELLEARTS